VFGKQLVGRGGGNRTFRMEPKQGREVAGFRVSGKSVPGLPHEVGWSMRGGGDTRKASPPIVIGGNEGARAASSEKKCGGGPGSPRPQKTGGDFNVIPLLHRPSAGTCHGTVAPGGLTNPLQALGRQPTT